MSTFTIKQGDHAHTLFPVSFLPWWRGGDTVTMSRQVKFDYPSCSYDSPTYNAEDVNKLWGLSFGLLPHARETHVMHALEVIGFQHPVFEVRQEAYRLYAKTVTNLHLNPETKKQMIERLGEDRFLSGTVVS